MTALGKKKKDFILKSHGETQGKKTSFIKAKAKKCVWLHDQYKAENKK